MFSFISFSFVLSQVTFRLSKIRFHFFYASDFPPYSLCRLAQASPRSTGPVSSVRVCYIFRPKQNIAAEETCIVCVGKVGNVYRVEKVSTYSFGHVLCICCCTCMHCCSIKRPHVEIGSFSHAVIDRILSLPRIQMSNCRKGV